MDKQELQTIWSAVTEAVKNQPGITPSQIDTFFSHLKLQDMIPGFCMITAESLPMKQWVDQYYLSAIEQAFFDIYQTKLTVMTAVEASNDQNLQATSPIPVQTSASSVPEIQNPTAPITTISNSGPLDLPEINPEETPVGTHKNPLHNQGPVVVPNPLTDLSTKPIFTNLNSIGDLPNPFAQPKEVSQSHEISSLDLPPINPQEISRNQDEKIENNEINSLELPFLSTMTFENFVVGDNNRLARDTALEVAKNPGKNPMLNPIFIYGKSGLGKTHLMNAIRNEVHQSNPGLKTEYVDAMALVSSYADACIESNKNKSSFRNFRDRYENADVLLIDDIQNLQGKTETLNMVFQIFNHCIAEGRQVVLSSDRAPKYIDLDERLISRFNGGAVWDILPYSHETRLAIIKQYLSDPSVIQLSGGSTLSPETQEHLARISGSNVRDLRSAVLRVLSAQTSTHRALTQTEIDSLLQDHFSNGALKTITADEIIKEVANFYRIKPEDLRSDSRERSIQHPRQVAMYLIRTLLNLTLEKIGEYFNRNHTTVRHSIDKIASDKQKNIELAGDLETLENQIREA